MNMYLFSNEANKILFMVFCLLFILSQWLYIYMYQKSHVALKYDSCNFTSCFTTRQYFFGINFQ